MKYLLVTLGRIVLATTVIGLLGCHSEPSPAANPPVDEKSRAKANEDLEELIASFSLGPHAAESLKDFVHANYPDWLLRGISRGFERDNFHCLSIDIARGEETKTINVVTRVFTHPDGTLYWKAEPITPELEQMARILFSVKEAGD